MNTIENNTYVIFDMEWNQPVPWIPTSVDPKDLPGEIIEIGAVKLTCKNGKYILSEPFQRVIRPVYYRVMNRNVSRVINKSSADLNMGVPFIDAYEDFVTWCKDADILCAWGDSDVGILKANLRIHNYSDEINDRFLDIQPFFARVAEDSHQQRSVAYAVDYFDIPQTDDFHSAPQDAFYEANILMHTLIRYADVTEHTPMSRKDMQNYSIEQYISNPNLNAQTGWKTTATSTEAAAAVLALSEKQKCPACHTELTEIIPWFQRKRSIYSLWGCEKNHMVAGRIRLNRTPRGLFYGSGILRLTNPNAARHIYEKWQNKETDTVNPAQNNQENADKM